MSDQSGGSSLVEIAAARALQWNVDFDRGLRSPKAGAQCEAVMKLGPQLVRWSHNCVVTASSANLFKLEPGQDRLYADAILLRLAETFRSSNNFVRICVLKALLLELKGRGWIGETFTGDNFEKILTSKKLSPKNGSHYRSLRKFRSGEEGLLTKKRIENHAEMLRRVKSVIDSGDPTSRALAIRVLGCLADLGKDSVDVHNLVLQAVHSPHRQEVSAALFAMGCLSELSDEFAGHSLRKAFEIINAMETPPRVKVLAIRLFAKLGHSPILSLQAVEMGRRIMLRYPLHEIITTMLVSLTMLAAESSVIMGNQVELLLTYIACDPRMNVRAIALKCLSKLVTQALCCTETREDIFNGVFAVVQDMTVPSALHVIALRVIRKLFHQCVATVEFGHLLQIISWIELTALCDVWPVVAQALSLLVEVVHDLKKYKIQNDSSVDWAEFMELSTRTCLLLCDQVSVAGLVATRTRGLRQPDSISQKEEEEVTDLTKGRVSTVCVLLAKLVHACPPVGQQVVESLSGIMGALAGRKLEQRNETGSKKGSGVISNQESSVSDKELGQKEQNDSGSVVIESMKATGGTYDDIEVLLIELGRCLSTCASYPEYKPKAMDNVHTRLLQLVTTLVSLDTSYPSLIPVLQALMKASLAHDSLTSAELENLTGSKTRERESYSSLLAQSRSALRSVGTTFMQGRSFRICYELGKHGALSAMWDLAHFTFDGLVNRINSDGCYFWLRGLSFQARAEALLHVSTCVDKGDSEQDRNQTDASSAHVPKEKEPDRDQDSLMGDYTLKSSSTHNAFQVEESILGRFSKAAADAVPLLHDSISSLSAGVCLERAFEFQRWVMTLRLEVLECVSKLVGLLARVSSLDAGAGVIDLEDGQNDIDMKSLGSALRASTEQIQLLASRLRKLSEEYDLLSISFMGIDPQSVGMLSRAALFCSLLTFCLAGLLSPHLSGSQLSLGPSLNVGAMALDLFRRLEQTESGDWDGLLTFAIQSGAGAVSERGFGGALSTGPLENALISLSKWAINSVLSLHKQHTLLGFVRGTRLLQEILQRCLCLPWPSPPFFFCTRPRTGVEFFLAQVGAKAGETEDLSVSQGTPLALSVCLQTVNAPANYLLYLRRLVCGLSVQSVESTSKVVDDPSSKSAFVGKQLLRPSVVEQLLVHSRLPNSSPGWGHGSTPGQSISHTAKDAAPELIFSISLDRKGQGFASCTLDVSQVPCGEYQLVLSCVCVDGKSGQWILPVLSTRPSFRIV